MQLARPVLAAPGWRPVGVGVNNGRKRSYLFNAGNPAMAFDELWASTQIERAIPDPGGDQA